MGLSLVQKIPRGVCVFLIACDLQTSAIGRCRPHLERCATERYKSHMK